MAFVAGAAVAAAQKELNDKREAMAVLGPVKTFGNGQANRSDIDEHNAASSAYESAMRNHLSAIDNLNKAKANQAELWKKYQTEMTTIDQIAAEKEKSESLGIVESWKEANQKVQEMREEARRRAAQPIIDAKKATEQINMTETQKTLDDFRRAAAASPGLIKPEELSEAKEILDRYDAAIKDKTMSDRAKELRESIQTPTERLEKATDELRKLRGAGKITDAEYKSLAAKAETDAFGETKHPALFKSGSAESMAARFDGMMQERGGGVGANTPLQTAIKSLAAQLETNRILQSLHSHASEEGTSNMPGVA